ncbi:MAG: sugar ABC transporter permease [Candidatus Omnitrophica bacterium]|nr:sugar ABC transporter permease [Candidatus Omnitrophota bacterium]
MSKAVAKKLSVEELKEIFGNYLFILPAVLIFTIFYIYPFFEIFNLSLRDWNGISLAKQFIGIDNFKEILQDKVWWSSMWHAGYITLIALTFQNALAFALALSCDRDIRMKKFYRVVFYLPPVLSEVVVGLIWQWILNSGMQNGESIGLLNYFLTKVHLNHLVHAWLSDPKTALTCIAVVHSWKGFGWGFIILLAGLQTIDHELYEAAHVDGAGSLSVFKNVTVPMMIPVFVMVMILTILGSMQVFVLVLSMVGQGLVYHTEVPVTRILASMTGTSRFGYACAQGIVFGLILMIGSFALTKISKKMKQE